MRALRMRRPRQRSVVRKQQTRGRRKRREPGRSGVDAMPLIGIDLAETRLPGADTGWLRFVVAIVLAAAVLVAMRREILRDSYEVGAALAREQALIERQRDLTVEMRTLRDPQRLSEQALEQGFVRPTRVIDLQPSPAARPPVPSSEPFENAPAALAARP